MRATAVYPRDRNLVAWLVRANRRPETVCRRDLGTAKLGDHRGSAHSGRCGRRVGNHGDDQRAGADVQPKLPRGRCVERLDLDSQIAGLAINEVRSLLVRADAVAIVPTMSDSMTTTPTSAFRENLMRGISSVSS